MAIKSALSRYGFIFLKSRKSELKTPTCPLMAYNINKNGTDQRTLMPNTSSAGMDEMSFQYRGDSPQKR
jgi:hypothetical protein